eukprot:6371018-Pyramimonas_sp.AAC.1
MDAEREEIAKASSCHLRNCPCHGVLSWTSKRCSTATWSWRSVWESTWTGWASRNRTMTSWRRRR